ncbi:response regulator [Salinimicrobium terrae]|uniref:response regulator n=1 Tax=Salinimicrobium terrae TaxID=470866 RepID=UPI0004080A9B|nr:response regulator [Salinimicrobium terrae]
MNLDVVVIDDDAIVLFLHKVLIKKSRLSSSVIDFLSAEEALEYIHHHDFSRYLLILLDINMPQCNGWEFLKKIESFPLREKIFVVMVTSSMNESDRQKAIQYSRVIDYYEKPLSKQACERIYMKLIPKLNS